MVPDLLPISIAGVFKYNAIVMIKKALTLLWEAGKEFYKDGNLQRGAAIAFFTTFSLVPLLIIGISVSGFFFGQESVRENALLRIEGIIGSEGISFLSDVMEKTFQPTENIVAAIIAIIALLFGAAGVFFQLKEAIFRMWEKHVEKEGGVKQVLKGVLLPFLFVFGTSLVFTVMSLFRTTLSIVSKFVDENVQINFSYVYFIDYAFSVSITVLVFMVIYRIFSPVKYLWKFALLGALVSAIILEIGKVFIDLYIGFAGVSFIYGAAGSLAILMFWIYFFALILLYGAEVAKVAAIEEMGKKRKKRFWFF